MRQLVIVRPEPGASATAARALELGLQPLILPLFRLEPIAWRAPEPAGFDALLLTSANAVRLGGVELAGLRALPVYAVGPATAAAAIAVGFTLAATGDRGVDDLLGRIGADLRLLHLCGGYRREPAAARQAIMAIPVYRSVALPGVAGLERMRGAVVMAHSPRAAARLSELAAAEQIDISDTALAAISAEAARAAGSGWRSVEAARKPDEPHLLALAARLCNNPG